jgi:hypothetical protein
MVLLGAVVGGAVALAGAYPPESGWIGAFLVLAGLYAVGGLVEFEVGAVHTDCSLAALAAMLVVLPAAVLPWCVALGSLTGAGVNVVRASRHWSRMTPAVAQISLPVLAPATVLALAPVVSSWSDWPVIAIALLAYVAADLVGSQVFARLAYGEPLAWATTGDAWVYAIDLLLAPLGVAMAIAAAGREWALLVVFLPLALLLKVFANERRTRIDDALELSRAYRGTAMLLGDVVETDDAYTGSHSRDVVEVALE